MLSTPSYFKLKSQLRLAAEHDPSTCIEFELRCNSAASNLRYKTVLPHSEYTPDFTKPSCPGVHQLRSPLARDPTQTSSPREARNRRSPARVPPVRRSVDSNGTRRNRRRPTAPRLNLTKLSPARDVPPTLARGERHPALRRRLRALAYPPRRVYRRDVSRALPAPCIRSSLRAH